jgi:hypothetical protein
MWTNELTATMPRTKAPRSRWLMSVVGVLGMFGCGVGVEEPQPRFEVGVSAARLDIADVTASHSAWSGKSAAQKATLSRDPSQGDYVQGFTMEERSDDPCYFNVLFDTIDGLNDGNGTWNRCDGSSGNFLFAQMPSSYRTTGVAVCLNDNKMKGFALLGHYPSCILDSNGRTPSGAPCNGLGPRYEAVAERTNCPGSKNGVDGDWEAEAECPVGQVVTGIEINHVAGGGNRLMMNGVRAICHPLLP